MVPFEDVLFQVRKALQVSPGLVHNLLRELHEADVFSTKYYQSLYKDGEVEEQRLCEVVCNDGEYLARRLSLPIWQNWDISQGILDSALRKLDDLVPSACRHRRGSSRAYWLLCGNCSNLSSEAWRDARPNEGALRPLRHVPPKRAWSRPINTARRQLLSDFSSFKRSTRIAGAGEEAAPSEREHLQRDESLAAPPSLPSCCAFRRLYPFITLYSESVTGYEALPPEALQLCSRPCETVCTELTAPATVHCCHFAAPPGPKRETALPLIQPPPRHVWPAT
ncbi:hypothetical protein PO909_001731 [Leuciscus waleckii]